MAQVLVIIGSPRKMGNSFKIVKRIEKRMRTLGDIEINYLFLRDAHLELCRGCWSCLSVGDDRCPLKDDREAIEKLMLDADGVIFASPVYALNVTALMKNLLDRFAYTLHRPRFFRQKAMIVYGSVRTQGGHRSPLRYWVCWLQSGPYSRILHSRK
jgi:multimeric flavodoxin WrbA